ncbi:hypothetical protein JCM8115_002944 [Rhodotorula mucilaginosa]|jgi:hypothetical protein|uniref:Uncharacterized protein n=1 Tax=Rhodotorula mucilaginosa TaxID=5537 RepID=A0A9P6VSV6_RHOMI|nr:hypothetical protein C6P46_002157 [Rhodotorula mucilaginosa]TKA51242.1 hypothetical protein B0A53_05818 [Rhodotorula sp. CCFEE 5036]
MATAFVPITSAFAPFPYDRLIGGGGGGGGGGHRTDSISSSVRPFPLSPTRRTFSVCDLEPKIKLVVPPHDHDKADSAGRNQPPPLLAQAQAQAPPPPYPYSSRDKGHKSTKAQRIEIYKDIAAVQAPSFRPMPLRLRPEERKRHHHPSSSSSRTVNAYLRARAAAATSNRHGFWRWRGLSLHDTFAPLELLTLGLVTLYAAAILVGLIESGRLDDVLLASGRKGLLVRRLEEITSHAFVVAPIAITARDRYLSLMANWSTGLGALIALGFTHLATRFFFLVVPYTFAIGCTFFGSAGFISGLYRLLTRNRHVLKPPTSRALRRNATLRRIVYLVDLTALVHFALTVAPISVVAGPKRPFATVWALYALVPSFVLVVLEAISNLRRSRNELVEAHAIKYRLPDKGDQLQSPYCPTDTSQLQLVTVDGLETDHSGAEQFGSTGNRRWV